MCITVKFVSVRTMEQKFITNDVKTFAYNVTTINQKYSYVYS
jgi:hypothetical protein